MTLMKPVSLLTRRDLFGHIGQGMIAYALRGIGGKEVVSARSRGTGEMNNPLQKFFPYGVYMGHSLLPMMGRDIGGRDLQSQCLFVIDDLQKHGMNCVYANNNSLDVGLKAWLAAARGTRVKIIHQSGGGPDAVPHKGAEALEHVEKQMIPYFERYAIAYRGEPALLAYSLAEEIPATTLPAVERMTRWLERFDPHHPGLVTYNNARIGAQACRIIRPKAICIDIYPFFEGWTLEASKSYYLRNISLLAKATYEVDCPLWVVGQAMSLEQRAAAEEPWKRVWRKPTEAELRFQLWGALYYGAKGFFWFVYHSQAPEIGERIQGLVQPGVAETDLMRWVAAIGAETKPFWPTILDWQPALPENDIVYYSTSSTMLGRTFEDKERKWRYVLTLNADLQKAQPLSQALLYYKPGCDVYDLHTMRQIGLEGAGKLLVPPGGGIILLVGTVEDFQAYRRRLRT